MAKQPKAILITGLSVLSIGAIYWIYNQFNLAMKYCYKIKDVKFNKIGLGLTDLTVFMAIRNWSNVTATVNKLDLDLSINDIWVSKILNSKIETKIQKNAISNIQFNLQFSIREILKTDLSKAAKLISNLTTNKDSILIKVKGTIGIRIGFLNFRNISVDVSMTMADILKDDPNAFICDIS